MAKDNRSYLAREAKHWVLLVLTVGAFIMCYVGLGLLPNGPNIYHEHGSLSVTTPYQDNSVFYIPKSKIAFQWISPLWALLIAVMVLVTSALRNREALLVTMFFIGMELTLLVVSASLVTRATLFCRNYECEATATMPCVHFHEPDDCQRGHDVYLAGICFNVVVQICYLLSVFFKRCDLSGSAPLLKNAAPTTFKTPSIEPPTTIPSSNADIYLDDDSMVD